MARRTLGTQFVKLETPGATFTGHLVGREKVKMGTNDVYQYTFAEHPSGAKCKMNGTDQLDDALAEATEGDLLEVKYMETVTTLGGYKVKRFEVSLLEEDDDDGS